MHTSTHLVLCCQQCICQDHEARHLLIRTDHPVQLSSTLQAHSKASCIKQGATTIQCLETQKRQGNTVEGSSWGSTGPASLCGSITVALFICQLLLSPRLGDCRQVMMLPAAVLR